MTKPELKIKVSFVTGLRDIVLNEICENLNLHVTKKEGDFIYLDFQQDLSQFTNLGSVLRAYVVAQNSRFTPRYISNHKSILENLISPIINDKTYKFMSFKISCAGSDSPEVRSIAEYMKQNYRLTEKEEADMKIHIIKTEGTWEIGVEATPRPLFLREYKVRNMEGAMDPTIAYAMNSLCQLDKADSYLNVFSGSATLLIEAAKSYPDLKYLVGFDNNKDAITLSIQNIKKSGLMKRIQLKGRDIFDKPDLGKFDAITSDLPFGMLISKDENLEELYRCFVEYCQEFINSNGTMVVYTIKHQLFKKIISESDFKVIKTLELKIITAADAYLHPKIFVCKLK